MSWQCFCYCLPAVAATRPNALGCPHTSVGPHLHRPESVNKDACMEHDLSFQLNAVEPAGLERRTHIHIEPIRARHHGGRGFQRDSSRVSRKIHQRKFGTLKFQKDKKARRKYLPDRVVRRSVTGSIKAISSSLSPQPFHYSRF